MYEYRKMLGLTGGEVQHIEEWTLRGPTLVWWASTR